MNLICVFTAVVTHSLWPFHDQLYAFYINQLDSKTGADVCPEEKPSFLDGRRNAAQC